MALVQWDGGAFNQDYQTWHHHIFAAPKNVDCWDEQLAKVMFGYRCGIYASIKFFPFMIMTGHTPRLRADNYVHSLAAVIDDNVVVEVVATQFFKNEANSKHP
jgi:hypothetical protein